MSVDMKETKPLVKSTSFWGWLTLVLGWLGSQDWLPILEQAQEFVCPMTGTVWGGVCALVFQLIIAIGAALGFWGIVKRKKRIAGIFS